MSAQGISTVSADRGGCVFRLALPLPSFMGWNFGTGIGLPVGNHGYFPRKRMVISTKGVNT